MRVESIVVGPEEGKELGTVESVNAVAGCGLEGDRHYRARGQRPGGALTLSAPPRNPCSATVALSALASRVSAGLHQSGRSHIHPSPFTGGSAR